MKAAQVAAAKHSAAEALKVQLTELARVREAAQASGWKPGFAPNDPQDLVPAPEAPKAWGSRGLRPLGGCGSGCGSGRARGRGGAGAANVGRPPLPEWQRTAVLAPVQLPTDPECAAQASDAWEGVCRGLLAEAARAQRKCKGAAAGPTEEEALEALLRFRRRVQEEPARRALMRRQGAQPKADIFEKTQPRVASGRAAEGVLPARSIANEFEATTFLPCGGLAARLEAARPGCLGEWRHLGIEELPIAMGLGRPKDFRACVEVAQRFGAKLAGIHVGRLARWGLTREYPFFVSAGLDYIVCEGCGRWVTRKRAGRHNARCIGDVAGRARVLRQAVADDLGVAIGYRHFAREGTVELRVEAQVEAAVQRAHWACFWEPAELRCSWRLARRGPEGSNVFPPPGVDSRARPAGRRRRRPLGNAPAGDAGALEGGNGREMAASSGGSSCSSGSDSPALQPAQGDEGPGGRAATDATTRSQPSCAFTLRSSYSAAAAHQPRAFLRPLTPSQLHSLGWMMQREGHAGAYTTRQTLRQGLAETDVSLEVCLERDFTTAKGGILADALGYGKTACMIALIAETRSESLHDMLGVHDWATTAGRRVLTNATLVVTPPNLFDQWLREFQKFVNPALSLRVVAVPNHNKLKTLTVADFLAADVVLVSFRFFFSDAYQRYFDELTMPGLRIWNEESLRQRGDFLRQRRAGRGRGTAGPRGRAAGTPAAAQKPVTATAWAGRGSLQRPAAGVTGGGDSVEVMDTKVEVALKIEPRATQGRGLGDSSLRSTASEAASTVKDPGSSTGRSSLNVVAPGTRVALQGLVAKPQFNGKTGRLVSYNVETGKWACALAGRVVNVKPANFQVLSSSSRRPSAELAMKEEEGQRAHHGVGAVGGTVADQGPCASARQGGHEGAVGAPGPRPALQLSNYYADLRSRKDYLPQRYLDLERRTRRLLREGAAEEIAQSPALFEMFHFRRVVFDEFHEVVRMSSQQAAAGAAGGPAGAPFYALHALDGRFHWGLTATPLLSSPAGVAHMASLLRVFVPYDDFGEAQRFLEEWVTSNTWDDTGVPVEEHWIEVDLSGAERALYLQQRNTLAESAAGGPDGGPAGRAAERRLLQLCTHFDPEGESAPDAEAVLAQVLRRHRETREQAVQRQLQCEARREALMERSGACDVLRAVLPASAWEAELVCAHCPIVAVQRLAEAAAQVNEGRLASELALVEGDLRRMVQAVLDGQALGSEGQHTAEGCEECRQLLQREARLRQLSRVRGQAVAEQRHAEQQLRFLECLVASLEGVGGTAVECSICLAESQEEEASILPCGHCFHKTCVEAAVAAHGQCPQCRRPTTAGMLTNIGEQLGERGVLDPVRRRFGSKVARVIERVKAIQASEGNSTKCIIFIQWDAVAAHLERAFRSEGISPLALRGHLAHRQKVIAKFIDGRTPEASVLLLSLEQSPTGMNLVCAHHVLLVHPMYAEQAEDAAGYEAQAIGRVRRQGQQHTVHVHRFVARGTVEESLARRHHAAYVRHAGTLSGSSPPGDAGIRSRAVGHMDRRPPRDAPAAAGPASGVG